MTINFKLSHPENPSIWTRIFIPKTDIKLVTQENGVVDVDGEEKTIQLLRIITKNVVKVKKPVINKGVQVVDGKGKPLFKTEEDYESYTLDSLDEIESLLKQL